ncbi:4Fe-4S dicluster domain-containing protein [Ammoniphilus sp. CFH 90114]|uniref:4Fe-4S dicluster domain-containing protein n=1 Tax=Ammoniphilus sp. CFH 90114 TaxID=2493665 RepID=UPI00100FCD85|nr:4Fe-4S dicluster domain-containing protein [Ammoniphilus sp. CFH 90114]RXT07943.1 4Fe-4S dicluster domain-containing protein [Ammoniphilus sp. CFH 90114]
MSNNISRRTFLKRTAASSAIGAVAVSGLKTVVSAKNIEDQRMGTVIDLTVCDGCRDEPVPLCVSACSKKNAARFPEPQQPIKPYWPQKKYEDWSDQREVTDRLTPYNLTFVDRVEVEHEGRKEEVFVPRRCMHCDEPTCMKLCPFAAIEKSSSGAVTIDDEICMGGAKCRDACPWDIPQRQAGVGLYMKLLPELAGGGVMYKCDFCADLLEKGMEPACVTSCPKQAIILGSKEEMKALAYERAKEVGGYVYGDKQNGGTATFYVSKVPFEKIDQAIRQDKLTTKDQLPGRPGMSIDIENKLDTFDGMMMSALIAPIAGAAAAGIAAYRTMKGEKKGEYE